MDKKYELTDETIPVNGKTLYRIQALKDFGDVKKGDLGGYVESEKNLSQIEDCWIYDDAVVAGKAIVTNNAKVKDNALVFQNANVGGRAIVSGESIIRGNAGIFGNSFVGGRHTVVSGNAEITGCAHITSCRDWALVDSFGSRERATTFFRCNDGKVRVSCGCFYGTIHQFEKKVRKTHKRNQFAKEYLLVAKLMKRRFKDVK